MIRCNHSKAHASRSSYGAAKVPGAITCTCFIAGNPSGISMQDFRYEKSIKQACHLRRRALPCSSCGKSAASLRATSGYMVCASLRGCRFNMGSITLRHLMLPNNSFKPTPCRCIGHVLCATLARVRRPATGRLNSGVRRHKTHWCNYEESSPCRWPSL